MSTPSTAPQASVKVRWFDSALVRVLAMAVVFTAGAVYEAQRLLALTDNDIWWHLATGSWILKNHAIPHSGIFSQSATLPWVDASWGFDLLTATAYHVWGLAGLPGLLIVLQIAVAVALFMLARATGSKFWPAVIVTVVAQCSFAPVALRPALCSMVLFAIELALLLRVRRSGNARILLWLPLMFLLWVNLDRQFSYGLLALVLFCLAVVMEELLRRASIQWLETVAPSLSLGTVGVAAAASLLATFVSPYGYHLHALVWQSAVSSAADHYFPELHAMRFRQPQDYVLMLLVMTAFFALGRRRSRDLFQLLLMIVCAVISFRFQRDAWLVAVASVGVLGRSLGGSEAVDASHNVGHIQRLVTAALVVVIVVVTAMRIPGYGNVHSGEVLLAKISENFPLRAADYIRQNRLPQPIFNSYNWGGFLTWGLPEYPVLIDGRADLYGEQNNIAYFQVTGAEIPLQSYAGFTRAQTILLEASSPLAQALATLPGFHVEYQDEQAVVIVRGGN